MKSRNAISLGIVVAVVASAALAGCKTSPAQTDISSAMSPDTSDAATSGLAASAPATSTTGATSATASRPGTSATSAKPGTAATTTAAVPAPVGKPGSFSFVVMPDTQNETSGSSTQFMDRARWIAANKARRNIQFVTSSGDVHNWAQVEPRQLQVSSAGMKVVESAGLPYTLALGNHDTAAVCRGGSACPGANTSLTVRNTSAFNGTYNAGRYRNVAGAYQNGKVDNIYATYTAGGARWMVLVLELWPRQAVIDWARQAVASHPKHNVIVVTHSYLNSDGSISASNGGYGATSPRHLFDTLISQYPNIKMVFSGHVGNAASRVDKGKQGNTIVSYLQCHHSNTDTPLRTVQVDVARNTVTSAVLNTRAGATYPGTTTTRTGLAFVR